MTLRRFLSYVLVAAVSAAVAFALPRDGGKLDRLDNLIEERFIGESDRQARLDAAANAMVDSTGDRWSYYMSAEEYALQQEQSENAFVGVGITIAQEDSGFQILAVSPGSGAAEAGLAPEDLLVEEDGQDVRQADLAQVRALVTGKEGTTVKLGLVRDGKSLTYTVQRRRIETPVADWQMLSQNTALVRIYNFDSRCAQETIAAIEEALAAGAGQIVFDVRGNPGGYASELVAVLDYLLPEGELFRTVRYDGKEQVDMSDESCLDIPMAVLVNRHSYSAAEFFAAALAEYDAAVVVGEQTVGKGYFQLTYPLGDGSAVALSVGKYFTPKGLSLADTGITPDVEVTLTSQQEAALSAGTLAPEEDPGILQALEALNGR